MADTAYVPPPPFTGGRWWMMIALLAVTNFMEVLDISIANVSLNSIAGSLGVSTTQGTWVITSYAVANAIAVPLASWLSRRFGQVRIFVFAIIGFTIASAICGLSVSLAMLITARIVQGAMAGCMVPLSQAMMINHSPPTRRIMALAIWSMTVTVGPVAGPLLGGWITDNYSWPWIFYINVPAGILAALGSWRLMRDRETPLTKVPVDGVGVMLVIIWVGALQILLDKGNELDWFGSPLITALAVIAGVGFCFFLVWELTDANPVVDLSLFRFRNFTVGITTLGLGYSIFFANVVLLPLLFQTQLGFTATWSGRITAPLGLTAVIFSPIVGRIMSRVDPRIIASTALGIFALCSFWRTGYTSGSDVTTFLLPQLLQGVGIACFFAPLVSISSGGLPPEKMASASGFQNFARMMLGSFGTSIIVTMWDHRAALHRSQLVETLPAASPRLNDGLTALSQGGIDGILASAQISRLVDIEAHMVAANDLFWLSGVIFVGLMTIVWIARRPFGGGAAAH